MGENPLKCTTQDEKGLILNVILFYLIFWSPLKIMNQKLLNFHKDYILDYYNSKFHHNHPQMCLYMLKKD
jgi:hypothetical protein